MTDLFPKQRIVRNRFIYDLPEGLRGRLFDWYTQEMTKAVESMYLEDISRQLQTEVLMHEKMECPVWSVNEHQTVGLLINEIELFLKEKNE